MKTTITQNLIFRNFSRLQRSCCSAVFLLLFLLSASSSWGQVTWISSSTSSNSGTSSSNNPTFAVPAGTSQGNLLVVAIFTEKGTGVTYTLPSGWTQIRATNDGANFGLQTFYKVAGASESGSYVFTQSTSGLWSGSISLFTGVNPSNPIGVSGGSAGNGSAATSPAITPTTAGTLILSFHGRKNATALTADATTTQRHSYNSGNNIYSNLLSTFSGPAANTVTTAKTATGNTSDRRAAQQIAINRAVVAGSTYTETFTAGGTFTVPNCVTSLTVEAWGAGGGGFNGDKDGGGKGGGGGGYAKGTIVNPSGPYTVAVGSGGAEDSDGSASTFGSTLVVANGGKGGTNQTTGGGNSGTGTTSGVTNPTTSNGGTGGNGSGTDDVGGGGGGAAGPNGNGAAGAAGANDVGGNGGQGNNGSGGSGGSGGNAANGVNGSSNALGGGGGGGGDNGTNGGNGGFPGGGGGGGENGGGSGANGLVIVTYTLPNNPTITLTNTTATACFNNSAQNVSLAYSATTGCPNKYSIDFASGITDVINNDLTGSSITIALPAGLAANTYTGTLTVMNSTYGFVSGTYSVSVTVNSSSANTAGVSSSTPTLCIGSALTEITHTTTGATGIGTATNLPAGVTPAWASNVITISGTPTASGTFTYSIPLTGGCGTVNATGTITVSPASVGGTVAGSATVCTGTNSTTLTLSGHTGTITRWESSTSSTFASAVTNIANTSTTLTATNLTATTYYRAVITSGSCTAANSAIATITVSPASVGGTIAGSATVCTGTNSTTLTLSGHTGSITRWERSTSSTFASAVTNIANTSTTLTATNLTATTYYRAVITSGSCTAANSATATVTVTVPTGLSASTSLSTICAGGSVDLTSSGDSTSIPAISNSNSTSIAIPDNNTTGISSSITVPTTCANASAIASVSINITHTYNADLDISLIAPNGSVIILSNDKGGSANNYTATFQTGGGTLPPGNSTINGTFAPQEAFSLFTGLGSGTWTLKVVDDANGDTGTLNSWGISFGSTSCPLTYAWSSLPTGYTSATQNPTGVAPTETTTYTVTATNAYGCTATASTEVTVNALPTATITPATATTFCTGGSVVLNANTGTGLSYQWKLNGVNITDATASSYTAETSGSYTVTVTNENNCSVTSDATTVTVNARPGSAISANENLCGTGSVTLTATDPGAGYTINWYNTAQDTQLAAASLTYTTPSLSTTTSYFAEIENTITGCKSENRTEVQAIIYNAPNTWVGGYTGQPNKTTDWFTKQNWSCGSVPNATTNVVIPADKTVSIAYRPNQIGAAAYTVTLQGNASLTVTEDHNLSVTNKVTVASGATFTVQNNASLVQTDNVANEGNITVQKSTPSNRLLKRFDAVLWSSPVVQSLLAVSPTTAPAYFMEHNPQANSWSAVSNLANADFTEAKGFLVRTPATFPATATQQWNVNFTGVPNNGDVTISAGSTGTSEKYLLVGNPYPSAISIAAFRAANPNITGVFYFFRKPNGVTGISSYGTLNASNTFASNDDSPNSVGAVSPGSVIPSGQGFFVAMKSNDNNGEVYFTNAMRRANDHGTFNRMNTNLDTYRLLVQTPVGGNSQFITNYDAETTSGYDVGYDAIAFTDGSTDLSMIMNSKNYRIQSRGQYNAADVIPVQFKTGIAGEHRIKLQDAQGVFAADQMVIIKDNLTGVQHNLTANGDYVFTATAGTFTNRFEVIYQQAYYTALQANSCGATIANMNSLVYADLVNGATGYRFKVVNNTTAAVQTIDRPQHWFAFNMLSAYDYNTPYTISVQVQKDGVWTGYYGATCTVNSPNIANTEVMQINPSQCGATLASLGTVIATTPVAGATGYKFRITNTTAGALGNNLVQEITRTNHWFTLAMLSRYNYGSSYAIEVAVKTSGTYTPYGNGCTVYAPIVPTLASCGQTVATATTLVRTTATNLATQYRFQVTRIATQETITFDTANYWFSFRVNVPGYAAGEQYGVRVAVMTAGAWSPYGDACDITAPIATARTIEEAAPSEANLFKPVAYPNPFASTFGISLATPSADVIHVMVYDLQGRLIEKQNVFVSQLDSLQIGTNYPSGDYLLVVAQGANIKSSHIHKD